VRWALRYVRYRVSVEFRILGPLEARSVGRRLELGGPRQRSVLAVLLLRAGEVVPTGALIDEVWGDEPPETAVNLLQGYVSDLRKVLGRDVIATRGRGYAIEIAPSALDLHRFEQLGSPRQSASR
jgi:DNA-binding SARP family transcriptional activator